MHTLLLAASIPVVEHLSGLVRLAGRPHVQLPYRPVAGMGTFPVRAFATLTD